ncbi:hypothetical protein GGH94_001359 [Coemansia aciculifera]|uniref:Myb-like domain-containing protein n=1 Tax=Coemansia aciculifera TaxID=417176 RepID=A0A9W8IL50_9FUNG|nr:hypothetical protein GGH94_001359 [Coemansia aciculifera]
MAKMQINFKEQTSRQRNAVFSRTHWSPADDETLLKMIDGPTMSGVAKWEQINKALGRTAMACKQRFTAVKRKRKGTDDRESIVTSEVQKQLETSRTVDWSQASQATGLGLRECLELSQYDISKARWNYGPDSFLQSMADRMTGFIKEHYPAPVPVNYRAASNYMWGDMDDCIRIHDMLQGKFKFKWTDAEYERAGALRAQGLTFKEVAQHLSPTLREKSVANALKRHSSPKPVQKPTSADELNEISMLVDEYAGKYPIIEIINKIRTQLSLGNRNNYHSILAGRIAAHPHYQSKLRDIDYEDLANRIATGQTTVVLSAKELDVPYSALDNRLRN